MYCVLVWFGLHTRLAKWTVQAAVDVIDRVVSVGRSWVYPVTTPVRVKYWHGSCSGRWAATALRIRTVSGWHLRYAVSGYAKWVCDRIERVVKPVELWGGTCSSVPQAVSADCRRVGIERRHVRRNSLPIIDRVEGCLPSIVDDAIPPV